MLFKMKDCLTLFHFLGYNEQVQYGQVGLGIICISLSLSFNNSKRARTATFCYSRQDQQKTIGWP